MTTGREAAHWGGAAVQVDRAEEQLLAGQFDAVGEAGVLVPSGIRFSGL